MKRDFAALASLRCGSADIVEEMTQNSESGFSTATKEYSVSEDPIQALARERFHVPHLLPLQRFVIANILDNVAQETKPIEEKAILRREEGCGDLSGETKNEATFNQLVLFPTGFGKSICFQLPSLLLKGLTVVVYPLLALMNDQKRRFDEAQIPCALFRGKLSEEEWHSQELLISSGKATTVVVNPEILGATKLRRFLCRFTIAHMVIDEAHCISEWGETFRPSYLTLGESARTLSPRILSAFTATAGPQIIASIEEKLFLGNSYELVNAEADRPNILYGVVPSLSPTRCLRRLIVSCKKPAIIFERSRPGTKIKAEYLQSIGFINSRFYHAGLSSPERKATEEWFHSSDDAILVSTNAYGMGMDKKNIRTVIHSSLPDSAEAYIQEAGRGGRDGKDALALLIDDLGSINRARFGKNSGATAQEQRHAAFALYPSLENCRREFLLHLLGEEETPVCGRCDNCLGKAHECGSPPKEEIPGSSLEWHRLLGAEGFLEALMLCNSHERAWTKEEYIQMLGPYGRGKTKFAGFLFGWTKDERRELFQALTGLGIIQIIVRGPWKNRISLSEKGRIYAACAKRLFRRT